jgi:glycosyltransferase involved in cell wall biosynthesis
MACGKPVIASAVGGLGDVVVHGETGLLVPPGDADALRLALRTLLANPELQRRMGAAGRERAKRYVVSAVVGRIERIYAELLGTGPTTAPAAPSASRRPAFVVIPRSPNERSAGSS